MSEYVTKAHGFFQFVSEFLTNDAFRGEGLNRCFSSLWWIVALLFAQLRRNIECRFG